MAAGPPRTDPRGPDRRLGARSRELRGRRAGGRWSCSPRSDMAPIGIRSAAPGAATPRRGTPAPSRSPGATSRPRWSSCPKPCCPTAVAGATATAASTRAALCSIATGLDRFIALERPGAAPLRGGRDAGGDPRPRRAARMVPAGRARHQVGHGGRGDRQRHPRQEPPPRRNLREHMSPASSCSAPPGERLICSPRVQPRALRGHHRWPGPHRAHPLGRDPAPARSPAPGSRRSASGSRTWRSSSTLAAEDAAHEYTVAWVDCLARGRRLGRGVYLRGAHVPLPARRAPASAAAPGSACRSTPRATCSTGPPLAPSTRSSTAAGRRRPRGPPWRYEPFFFPLDALGDWNRLYGARGIPPVPVRGSRRAGRRRRPGDPRARQPVHGDRRRSACSSASARSPSPGLLPFLDPGSRSRSISPSGDSGPWICWMSSTARSRDAGGAVYPAKDARMSAESFRAFFPAWRTFADPGGSPSSPPPSGGGCMTPDPPPRRILIVGATSAIAAEVARAYAERGAQPVPGRTEARAARRGG